MYQCTNDNCNKRVTHVYAQGLCASCFFHSPKQVDSAYEVSISPKNASEGRSGANKSEFTPVMKDKINEMVKEVIDTTSIPLSQPAYTRLDVRISHDSLKQKIKENVAINLREL